MHRLVLASALVFLASVPAMAGPLCLGRGGAHISFGISIGEFSESERNEFYLMRLKQRGVDATDVRTWGECLQVFVRKPGGGEEMQYFDPSTLERVQ
ncbi:MAG: hypothetical protein KIT02_16355 [Devosia sp.]|uniref:hypothetical protein n=1 Tax=Devosia sp. TaxID=1871048 RepID=UPI0024CDB2EE|nr:hypothetical protein [Devosia sp.]UYN99456.1 MAG: hypothetical protein KIT02_16355 [Devosia sp.]